MVDLKEENLFRLSALLYKDDNYNVKRDTTLKKIIESLFIENNNPKSITEIIEASEINYSLILADDEIERIVTSNDKSFCVIDIKENELIFRLTDKRYVTMKKFKNFSIDSFICGFIKEKGLEEDRVEVENLLYRFFHDIFTSNYDAYRCALNNKFNAISINNERYSNKDKEIINSFLNYDNTEKDKAIFNLVNLALEYCMLTGDNKSKKIGEINNKVFYLDTNIIYRGIGINGENRKETTLKFLDICRKNSINLKITQYTRDEFNATLDYYCRQIEKNKKAYLNEDVYFKYNKGCDFYKSYVIWKGGRCNTDVSLYKAHIKGGLVNFLKEYNIDIECKLILKTDEVTEEEINRTAASISLFKGENFQSADVIDAKNLMYINRLRGGTNKSSIMEIKEFIISTDGKLRAWEYSQLKDYEKACVFLPTQWMSIILRFSSRTKDDLKSFTSFLNMTTYENVVDVEKLNMVLDCINEMTEDVKSQAEFADEVLNQRVEDIIHIDNNEDLLRVTVKEIVTESIDSKMKDMQREMALTKKELSKQNIKNEKTANDLTKIIDAQKKGYIRSKIIKWKIVRGVEGSILIIVTVIFFMLHIFFQQWDKNVVVILYNWAGDEEIKKAVAVGVEGLFGGGTFFFAFKLFVSAFKENKSIYDKIANKYEEDLRNQIND